jgi:hypothetical protein
MRVPALYRDPRPVIDESVTGKGNAMNGYTDTQMIVVTQILAERRADAVAHWFAADWRRGQAARGRAQQPVPWQRRLTAPLGTLRPVARPSGQMYRRLLRAFR